MLARFALPPLLLLLVLTIPANPQDKKGSLGDRIGSLVKAHKGMVAVAIKHLDWGETYTLNGDEVMPSASLIKFPILIEVYHQIAERKIKLDEMITLRDEDKVPGTGVLTYHFSAGARFPLRDAMRLMMAHSDNTATNIILDRTGLAPVNARMIGLGCPNTRINAQVYRGATTALDKERTRKYGLGSTTAKETISLLEQLHKGKLVSRKACDEMIETMKKCENKDMLKRYLPANLPVAHKTGNVDDARIDAGILYLPTGPVAICVLTNDNEDRSWDRENAAEVLIGKIAKETHDYFLVRKNKK